MSVLNAFLRTCKGHAQHGAQHWCVGNEAGDLDSVACALAYAYLETFVRPSGPRWMPALAMHRADLALRLENEVALRRCGIDVNDMCCLEDIPPLGPDAEVVLVDHNHARGAFARAKVVGILDHHADEGQHTDAATRIVCSPEHAGSCASVLTMYFAPQLPAAPPIPRPLADLLLSAISIDTVNFSPSAGKAQAVDFLARDWLLPHSSFAKEVTAYFTQLRAAKKDVGRLTTPEHLRRDYKQFSSEAAGGGTWEIGASSILESLADFSARDGSRDAFVKQLHEFATARQLDVLVVVAGYRENDKSRRALLWYVPQITAANKQLADAFASCNAGGVDLEPMQLDVAASECLAWLQRDPHVTRKQFVPALREVCASVPKPG
ncbi:exopolyphosphatase [Malassezia sp. CBS 17886]|nr:exopolyphosphatase [Malassezia sp. CBS 17886]